MNELERKIAAKIPGGDTGIVVKKSLCDICTPTMHCGMDVYVKDGVVIKVEGTAGHPVNNGLLCTKGASNRAYIYRKDRLRTPMKRVGPRGSGKLVAITWDEAYELIKNGLNKVRDRYGPNSVAFFSGYGKWYRFMLQRFAHVFGSVNYGSESSVCFTASKMAWELNMGSLARPDVPNSNLFLGWAFGGYYSRYTLPIALEDLKKRGGKIIIVDPRITPATEHLADLHLRVRPGTDGLLANGIAGVIIREGLHNREYIEKYVSGFEEYSAHVLSLRLSDVSGKTGVPEEQIIKAARMIAENGPMSIENNPTCVIQHSNGLQTARAIFALSAITGNYDRAGGNVPIEFTYCELPGGFPNLDEEFAEEKAPADFNTRIGALRYPLWEKLVPQFQAMDLMRHINEGTPYPVRAIFGHGMNYRMFPSSTYTLKAVNSLDFFVNIDLFNTDTMAYADVVLPACSSVEREEFKVYPGGYAMYYSPAIEPLYESRNDARILQELAVKMDLDDDFLKSGYRACIEHILEGTGIRISDIEGKPLPVKVPIAKPPAPSYSYLDKGARTPSGKIELYSNVIASCDPSYNLKPLPEYEEPSCLPTEDEPFVLSTGVRLPNAIHTRLNNVPWPRSLRPEPMADINPEDAKRLGIAAGDAICLYNQNGSITVKANPTMTVLPGQVYMLHGYSEADVSVLMSEAALDPYSGFPSLKKGRCNIRKAEGGSL